MKNIIILSLALLIASCGKSHKALEHEAVLTQAQIETIDSIVAKISYPQIDQMSFDGELIADLSSNTPVVSSLGTVSKGTTLNYITFKGIEFLVYGEDGVFATECEPSALYPDHGSTNANCEVAHAESFDRIILCTARTANVSLATAQNWPGAQAAMEDDTLGMVCWVNGVKMKSNKIFTY